MSEDRNLGNRQSRSPDGAGGAAGERGQHKGLISGIF